MQAKSKCPGVRDVECALHRDSNNLSDVVAWKVAVHQSEQAPSHSYAAGSAAPKSRWVEHGGSGTRGKVMGEGLP
jgi:hypothetical protein